MVDKFEGSVRVVDESDGMETVSGRVEVVLDVNVEVTDYQGSDEGVTDEDIEKAATAAIQEGRCRVVEVRPVNRKEPGRR